MSRGDQRERDRAKNLAKLQAKAKQQSRVGSAGDPQQRNESDAAALAAKVAAKRAKQEQEANAGGVTSTAAAATRKKTAVNGSKDTSLDDLLAAGLGGGKTKRAK